MKTICVFVVKSIGLMNCQLSMLMNSSMKLPLPFTTDGYSFMDEKNETKQRNKKPAQHPAIFRFYFYNHVTLLIY